MRTKVVESWWEFNGATSFSWVLIESCEFSSALNIDVTIEFNASLLSYKNAYILMLFGLTSTLKRSKSLITAVRLKTRYFQNTLVCGRVKLTGTLESAGNIFSQLLRTIGKNASKDIPFSNESALMWTSENDVNTRMWTKIFCYV